MEIWEAEVVIVGSGPAGQKAAIQAIKLGKKVVMIEKEAYPGGNSLYTGTIPSKTMREAVIDLTGFHDRYFLAEGEIRASSVRMDQLLFRLHRVVEEEKSVLLRQFKRNHVQVIQGNASFIDPFTLEIKNLEGEVVGVVKGKSFILATGSQPRRPVDIPFDGEVIFDSNTLLGLQKIPNTMIVLGGGVIGAEYASFFAALGTEVTIVDKREHILPMLDAEIGVQLQTALTDIGLIFKGKKNLAKIEKIEGKARVTFEDGEVMEAEAVLYALGRKANVETLNIQKVGITLNEKGYIPVNALFQTAIPHIFAAGDVIGGPCLASTSMEQGRLAAKNVCGVNTHRFPDFYPIGIYTIPEISSCGYTEEELIKKGYHYEVGRAYYYEIARSHIAGSPIGMFKIIFHKETKEILGVHIIGMDATEMIHIGQVAMSFGAKIDYLVDQVFNYPTYAEGYRIAALNGLNKVNM